MKAQIWNKRKWIKEVDPYILKNKYSQMIKESGFTILSFTEHHFMPVGWTGIWLLAESHLAIHTFPEEGKTYIELSSCNKKYFKRCKI